MRSFKVYETTIAILDNCDNLISIILPHLKQEKISMVSLNKDLSVIESYIKNIQDKVLMIKSKNGIRDDEVFTDVNTARDNAELMIYFIDIINHFAKMYFDKKYTFVVNSIIVKEITKNLVELYDIICNFTTTVTSIKFSDYCYIERGLIKKEVGGK